MRLRLPRSFAGQLQVFGAVLLLALLALAATLGTLLALHPSAEQMARTLAVISAAAERELSLQATGSPHLSTALDDAGVFPVLPAGSQQVGSWLQFPHALRERLQQRLQRPVQLVRLPSREIAFWLPASAPEQLPFGLRFEQARRPIAEVGLWIALGSGALLLAAAAWLARWLGRPLRRLSAALPSVAAGAPMPDLGSRAPEELQALADALDAAMQRLRQQAEAREQTLAGISHDLRTPLMRIALATQLLPAHPRIAGIEADIEEMDRMIGAALELARAGNAEAEETVTLRPLVERLLAGSGVGWRIDVAPDLQLRVPPIALRRALDNLIRNAERHGCAPFAVHAARVGERIEISVIDHGPGLGELSPDRATEPFRQGRAGGTGNGLGLAIVKRLAAGFGATLHLNSDTSGLRATLSVPDRVRGAVG